MMTTLEGFTSYFDKVLNFLSYRPRSEFEVNEYMLRKGWSEKIRQKILKRLKDLKLLDDESFARQWLASRTINRPEGRALIRLELKRKGISKELIEKLLAEERGSAAEQLLAEEYCLKRKERLKNLPVGEARKKLYSALTRRGFSGEIAGAVVDKLLQEE